MLTQQLTMHPRLPGFGLGWQESDANGEHVVEHGGDVAGFATLMTLLPERGVGLFVAGRVEGSGLRYALQRAFLDRFYPPPARPAVVAAYRASIACHTCARPMPVSEVDVVASADGTLAFWDGRWVEVADAFFRTTDGERRVSFRRDAGGAVTHLTAGSFRVMERVR